MAEKENKTNKNPISLADLQIFAIILIDSVGTYVSYQTKDFMLAFFLAGLTAIVMWIAKTKRNKIISGIATCFVIIICLPRAFNQTDSFSEKNRVKQHVVLEKEYPTPKEPSQTNCDQEKWHYKLKCQENNQKLMNDYSVAVQDIASKNEPIKQRNSQRLAKAEGEVMTAGDWSLVYLSAVLSVFMPIFFFFLIHPEMQFGLSQEEIIIKLYKLNLAEAEIIRRSGATRGKVVNAIKAYKNRINRNQTTTKQQPESNQSQPNYNHNTTIVQSKSNQAQPDGNQTTINTVLWTTRGKPDPLSSQTRHNQNTGYKGRDL